MSEQLAVGQPLLGRATKRFGWSEILIIWLVGNATVWVGLSFGTHFVSPNVTGIGAKSHQTTLDVCCRWDGQWYAGIADDGYSWNAQRHSNVAFFPGFPFLGWLISQLLGVDVRIGLLLVSNGSFLLALRATADYVAERFQDSGDRLIASTLLVLGFFPAGVFFRLVYSESLFLLCVIHFLLAIQRQRSLVYIGFLCGCATAVRPVGIGLLLPMLWLTWRKRASIRAFIGTMLWIGPISVWGLLGYMVWLWVSVGHPLAFVLIQDLWAERMNPPLMERVIGLVTLRPIWEVFFYDSRAYWGRTGPDLAFFNWRFWNPIVFLSTLALLGAGFCFRSLNRAELLAGLGLWVVPYVTHSHRILMQGHSRFSVVIFPAYVVVAIWLTLLPRSASGALLAFHAALLLLVSAMFAAGFEVF